MAGTFVSFWIWDLSEFSLCTCRNVFFQVCQFLPPQFRNKQVDWRLLIAPRSAWTYMPWCGLENAVTPVTLISFKQQLAENDGYHFWHENLLLGIFVLCLCERSTGALEKLVSHQEWSLIYISGSLDFLIYIFEFFWVYHTECYWF